MDIGGKSALITGSGSGIGRATALKLAGKGAVRLSLIDIDEHGLAETAAAARKSGADVETQSLDLSDLETTQRWFGDLALRGVPDIVHNNAGVVSGARNFPDMPLDKLHRVINVNLTSLIIATQTAAQAMRDNGGGVIVNTISTVALGTGFTDTLYATTKAGAMMFTRCCAPLKESWNVRVAGILPGLTDTPILHTTGGDRLADWMTPVLENNEACRPEDIADGVIDLIENDRLAGGDWVAVRRENGKIARQWGHDIPV